MKKAAAEHESRGPHMDYIEDVRRIVLAGLKGHPAKVYLHGSRARGDAARWSDIDVAVLPLEPFPLGLLAAIREELEESRVPYKVDVVDLSKTEPSFRERIKREGVLWTA